MYVHIEANDLTNNLVIIGTGHEGNPFSKDVASEVYINYCLIMRSYEHYTEFTEGSEVVPCN